MELEPIAMPSADSAAAPAAPVPAAPGTSNTNSTTSNANSPPAFDLDAYLSRYEPNSETRLQRLLLIASVSSSKGLTDGVALARQAYRMAERQCRDAANVVIYRQVFGGQQQQAAGAGAAAAAMSGEGSGGKSSNLISVVYFDGTMKDRPFRCDRS